MQDDLVVTSAPGVRLELFYFRNDLSVLGQMIPAHLYTSETQSIYDALYTAVIVYTRRKCSQSLFIDVLLKSLT